MNLADPVDVIARTIWGEARGCGAAGMRHVASVIMNRAAAGGWWGSDPISVCLHPFQFSCLNPGDPNKALVESVTTDNGWFLIAQGIAQAAIAGKLHDDTLGADSYFALSMKQPPAWIASAKHTFSDGWHSFWITRGGQIRNISRNSVIDGGNTNVDTADALNAGELAKINSETQA